MPDEYDKLVRDRIPEVIRADGEQPVTHRADDAEFADRLADKLVEEATEFRESGQTAELADVLAVLDAIQAHRGVSDDRLRELQAEKAASRGEFEDRVVLDRVER